MTYRLAYYDRASRSWIPTLWLFDTREAAADVACALVLNEAPHGEWRVEHAGQNSRRAPRGA